MIPKKWLLGFFQNNIEHCEVFRYCSIPSTDLDLLVKVPSYRPFFPECYRIKFFLHSTVKSFTDNITLRMPYLRFAMAYALKIEIKFILMTWSPFILCSSISKSPQQGYVHFFKEGKHPVIYDICSCNYMF